MRKVFVACGDQACAMRSLCRVGNQICALKVLMPCGGEKWHSVRTFYVHHGFVPCGDQACAIRCRGRNGTVCAHACHAAAFSGKAKMTEDKAGMEVVVLTHQPLPIVQPMNEEERNLVAQAAAVTLGGPQQPPQQPSQPQPAPAAPGITSAPETAECVVMSGMGWKVEGAEVPGITSAPGTTEEEEEEERKVEAGEP
eukprot:scaffold67115_cov19-Tisochrysis_lutea.AAC.4